VADLTDAQRKRAEARQRRRAKDDAPEEPEASSDGAGDEPHHAVKQAAKVAAAVGAAGAAAAAAKVLTSHNENEAELDTPEATEPQAENEQQDAEIEDSEQRQKHDGQEPQQNHEQEPEQEQSAEPVAGAPPSDARKVIDRAREQLQELLERPVESVSSLERTHDGWVAQLEVVEVKRIPETTDVLASYEMELDDELNLRRYQQARRYSRSQADRGEGS
jgi:Gas vesicle synthesis protein GvpO